ncbi:MAG: hypothetical protein IJU50_10185 [Lachnospiraceae bacterium]|nr:hypothetical protein [Lachnospiraceae bacterium]
MEEAEKIDVDKLLAELEPDFKLMEKEADRASDAINQRKGGNNGARKGKRSFHDEQGSGGHIGEAAQ